MTGRIVSVALAAVALAGAAAIAVPQHAASLAVLAAATVAVVAAMFLLVLAASLAPGLPQPWPTPDRPAPTVPPPLDPHGLRDARRDLAGRRDGPVPAAVRRRLASAAEQRLARLGTDVDGAVAAGLLPADAVALLADGAADRDPAPRAAAEHVHQLLDHLDRLRPGGRP